jgi:hypothetical protein
MTHPKLVECPFCNNAPRYLEAKAGFHTERVICDHCNFYLEATATQTAPERWNASKTPTRSLEESKHLQDLAKALDQCLELRQQLQLAMNYQGADYWIWNPHEDNDLASMGNRMAVLVYACDLRAALESAPKPRLRAIKDCRDMFFMQSVSWNLLDQKLQAESGEEVELPRAEAQTSLRAEFDSWWNEEMKRPKGAPTDYDDRAFYPYKAWKEATLRASTKNALSPNGASSEPVTELPPITNADRQFLHDNPNTDDIVKWVQNYAGLAIALASSVQQPYLWVSPEQAANIVDYPPGEGGRYLPVRKSCDGKFTEPLFRRAPKSQSYMEERSQLDAEWISLREMRASFGRGSWLPAEEIKGLVRQLDVLLNGEAGAAKQATLGDLVSQVRRIVSDKGNSALLDLLP